MLRNAVHELNHDKHYDLQAAARFIPSNATADLNSSPTTLRSTDYQITNINKKANNLATKASILAGQNTSELLNGQFHGSIDFTASNSDGDNDNVKAEIVVDHSDISKSATTTVSIPSKQFLSTVNPLLNDNDSANNNKTNTICIESASDDIVEAKSSAINNRQQQQQLQHAAIASSNAQEKFVDETANCDIEADVADNDEHETSLSSLYPTVIETSSLSEIELLSAVAGAAAAATVNNSNNKQHKSSNNNNKNKTTTAAAAAKKSRKPSVAANEHRLASLRTRKIVAVQLQPKRRSSKKPVSQQQQQNKQIQLHRPLAKLPTVNQSNSTRTGSRYCQPHIVGLVRCRRRRQFFTPGLYSERCLKTNVLLSG